MNLQGFKLIAFIISLAGLLLLLWVHIAVLIGKPPPVELSFVKIFFVLFPLWAFTIYYLNKTTVLVDEEGLKQMNIFQKIQYLLGNPPVWAMYVLVGFYLYGLQSLFLFMTEGIIDPEYINGQYQFNNHGKITTYTEAEYQSIHKLHLRSVTGFFMVFFSVSTVVLAPWWQKSSLTKV